MSVNGGGGPHKDPCVVLISEHTERAYRLKKRSRLKILNENKDKTATVSGDELIMSDFLHIKNS